MAVHGARDGHVHVRLIHEPDEIVRGKLHPFAGPVKDNAGKVVVPAGKTLSDPEMLSFNWFVEGVEGTLPKK